MHDVDPLAPFSAPQVVRCFEDDDVIHVAGKVDPVADIDVINFELALADIGQLEKRQERLVKGRVKSREEEASQQVCLAVVHFNRLHGSLFQSWHGQCALLRSRFGMRAAREGSDREDHGDAREQQASQRGGAHVRIMFDFVTHHTVSDIAVRCLQSPTSFTG